jgi:hypothetical protein
VTAGRDVLELRMRRSWRLVVATAVVVAAVIILLGTDSILAEGRLETHSPGPGTSPRRRSRDG